MPCTCNLKGRWTLSLGLGREVYYWCLSSAGEQSMKVPFESKMAVHPLFKCTQCAALGRLDSVPGSATDVLRDLEKTASLLCASVSPPTPRRFRLSALWGKDCFTLCSTKGPRSKSLLAGWRNKTTQAHVLLGKLLLCALSSAVWAPGPLKGESAQPPFLLPQGTWRS